MKKVEIVKIKMVKIYDFIDEFDVKIKNPWDCYKILDKYLDGEDRENFIVITLNTKNVINNITTVSVGSLSSAIVNPREVFKTAILSNANSIIIAHNHPSGEVEPSNEDIAITKRLIKCGELLGINVLDHIIVGEGVYYSFKENFMI